MKNNIKLVILYQVIMHYRLPLYKRINEDSQFDFTLLYGKGQPGTKLVNADISETNIRSYKLQTIRIPFKTNNSKSTIPFSPFLFFKLIGLSPDVVFSEGASSLINSLLAFLYAKLFNRKFIWWSLGKLQDREFKGIRKLFNNLQVFIERRSDAIFTYSTQGAKYFIDLGIPPERVFVGVNVIDTNEKLREMAQLPALSSINEYHNNFNIAFIGSITEEKNLEMLIDAVKIFNQKHNNNGRLHIIGDGKHLNALINYTNINQCSEFVVFYGRINKGANAILRSCDLMVLPGLGGLAICEAMINKLPVITGNADGTEYDLIDDSCGFILPGINANDLSVKLEFLFLNPAIRKEMGLASFNRITRLFSFDDYYYQFKKAIIYAIKR